MADYRNKESISLSFSRQEESMFAGRSEIRLRIMIMLAARDEDEANLPRFLVPYSFFCELIYFVRCVVDID